MDYGRTFSIELADYIMDMKGIGASPGIAIGKALVIEHKEMIIEKKEISDVEVELARLASAVETSKKELMDVKEKVAKELGEEESEIVGAHLLVLEDPEFIGEAENKIKNESLNAEYALNEVKDMFVSIFESMDNDYMRERAADVKDVTNRVLRHILGIKVIDLSSLADERSEEHTSELQSRQYLVCRLLLEKKKKERYFFFVCVCFFFFFFCFIFFFLVFLFFFFFTCVFERYRRHHKTFTPPIT